MRLSNLPKNVPDNYPEHLLYMFLKKSNVRPTVFTLSDIFVQIFRNMYISPHFALQKPEKNTSRILSAYIMITNDRAFVH